MVQSQEDRKSGGITIGALAKRGAVNVETVRYYQRRGLLKEPSKPLGGFRYYPESAVKRILFIRRAQTLGFTLEEILGLLSLDQRRACRETRSIAANKVELINEKIAQLSKIKRSLSRLLLRCDSSIDEASCPIIDLLTTDS